MVAQNKMEEIKNQLSIIVENEKIEKEIAIHITNMIHSAETLLMRELQKKDEQITDLKHELELCKKADCITELQDFVNTTPQRDMRIKQQMEESCKASIKEASMQQETSLREQIENLCLSINDLEKKNGEVSGQLSRLVQTTNDVRKRKSNCWLR